MMKKSTEPQWKDLDPFLLCLIFGHLSLEDQLSCVPFVCHSWLSALLHTLFGHPNLDLTSLQDLDELDQQLPLRQRSRYFYLLKLAIRHCKNWVSLSLPCRNLPDFATLMCVAEQTPSIGRVVVPHDASGNLYPVFIGLMYWRNLRAFHAPFRGNEYVVQLADYCEKIEELGLHGPFSEKDVSCIVEGFPRLKVLDLSHSTLPAAAVSMVLDGRLKCIRDLNVAHCKFLDEDRKDMRNNYVKWKAFRLEILEKASGISSLKKFMHCFRERLEKPCEKCSVIDLEKK